MHAELLCDVSFYFNSYNCKTTKRNDYMMDEQVQLETVTSFLSVTVASQTALVILCAIKPLRPAATTSSIKGSRQIDIH